MVILKVSKRSGKALAHISRSTRAHFPIIGWVRAGASRRSSLVDQPDGARDCVAR